MAKGSRRRRGRRAVRCPVCGSRTNFSVYMATVAVHHIAQDSRGRWTVLSADPKRLHRTAPLLMVCESCAHPLGAPPTEVWMRIR